MTVLHGDCIEMLRSLPDSSVDSVITDPPYCSGAFTEAGRTAAKGQGLRSETLADTGWFKGDNMGTAGIAFLLRAVAVECRRVLKPSGSLLVFCDWRMLVNLAPAIESAGFRYSNLLVWDKQSMGLGTGFRVQHELVMHFTNGAPGYHNKATSNVLRAKRVNHLVREHQTQKPVDLMEQLIRVVTPPGGVVLDPFTGSGSTGVAAVSNGYTFIGVEQDAAYVRTARARLAAATGEDLC